MDPDPIFAELTALPTGAHSDGRPGARTVMDLIRAMQAGPDVTGDDPGVGLVPGVLTFSPA